MMGTSWPTMKEIPGGRSSSRLEHFHLSSCVYDVDSDWWYLDNGDWLVDPQLKVRMH